MAGTFVQPSKNAQLKLTVETDRDAVPLQELFEDIAKNDEEASRFISSNVLTFQYFNQEDCSILVSKQGGRYRIQSSSLPALWLLTEDLCSRIHRHFKKKTEKCKLIFEEPLPMQEYFEIVDGHFNLRCAYREQELMLSQLTHQFRAIEKRLLVRFKDRNPAPLNSFDLLFESTYAEIQSLADAMSANRKRLVAMGNKLSCVTALVLLLAKLRFAIPEEDYQVLVTALSPDVDDTSEQGWEETVDAAMTHLLRTYLAKNAREAGSVAQSITFPTDTSRLKKHIALVIDRVGKGGKLSPREPTADASKPKLSSGRGSRGRPSASVAAKQSQENVTED
jgi:Bardet-Biedl syndrome 9 protein